MKFRPVHDRLLVRQHPEESMSRGGIFIPHEAREKMIMGDLIACGPDVEWLHVGEVIMFSPHAGHPIKIGAEDFLLMKEADVMGVMEPTEADKKKAA